MLHLRPTPRVDTLCIISHRHHLMMSTAQCIDKVRLQPIRILILIYQDMLKSCPISFAEFPWLLQQPQRKGQKIIIIHRHTLPLPSQINLPYFADRLLKFGEIAKLTLQNRTTRRPMIRCQTKNFR